MSDDDYDSVNAEEEAQYWKALSEEVPLQDDTAEPVSFLDPFAPEGGFHPDDFPKLSAVMIPYSSNSGVRSDPSITIIPEGWMFIELGHVRLAIPDREEWAKLVNMGERLWNTHEHRESVNDEAEDDPRPAPA